MRAFRTALTSPIFLKATSLIIGFLLWSTVNHLFTQNVWLTVPVCFYNIDTLQIEAPETINVELTGKRAHIKQINPEVLAVHIDASRLKIGTQKIPITAKQLLLPSSISVTSIIPHPIIITVTRGES